MIKFIDSIRLPIFIVLSLTLGLAPFLPEPHIVQKVQMLINGELEKPIDIFDLVLHGTPWVLLMLKLSLMLKGKQAVAGN